jgi:hypothetical protein
MDQPIFRILIQEKLADGRLRQPARSRATAATLSLFLFLLATATTQIGCASIINGTSQDVGFRSVPSGATVTVSGQTSTTPTTLKLSRSQEHTATFTKDGHPDRQANLKQKLGGAFYGNIALGGIIGMAVDMGNGAAHSLSPGNVEMDMASGLVRQFDSDEPVVRAVEYSPPPGPPPPPPPSPTTTVTPPPTLIVIPVATAPQDPGLRYVAPNKGGGGFVLWASLITFNNCVQATTRGTEQSRRISCEDGVAGVKPKLGEIDPGTEIELLDSRECGGDMGSVRVLAGPYRGEMGCLASIGISRLQAK